MKTATYNGKEIEFHLLPTGRLERAEILHRLENSKTGRELWLYDPRDILEWLEELSKSRHVYAKSQALMIEYLKEFNPDDI